MRLCLILSAVAALAFFVIGCEGGETKLKCTSHDDCFDGYRCDLVDSKTCLSACKTHRECLAGQVCDIPTGEDTGVCRSGSSSGGDSNTDGGGGDPAPGDTASGDPASGDFSGSD